MASWQYRCKSCGETHAAVRLPEGAMYLRCLATREWAWYEPSNFLVVAGVAGARGAGGGPRAGASNAGRRKVAARRRAPAGRTRRAAVRKAPQKKRKRG